MADIYMAVRPIMVVTKLIGLCPFYIDEENLSCKLSISGTIYSAVMLVLFTANSIYTVYSKLTKTESETMIDAYLSDGNELAQLACGIGVTICTIGLTLIQRNKFINVVQKYHEVDTEMLTLDIKTPYEKINKYSQIQLGVLIFVCGLLWVHDFTLWWTNGTRHTIDYWITYFAPNIYNFIMEYQFISGALLLKKHFTDLNTFLMNSSENNETEIEALERMDLTLNANGWLDNLDSYLGPKIVDYALPQWDGNLARIRPRKVAQIEVKPALTHASLGKIKTFRKIHSGLCEIKESLNSAFSLQLLTSVAQAFVVITSNLYLLFTILSDTSTERVNFISYPIVWSFTHVVELVVVVVTCTKTSKMANHTAVVVHKLLAKDCDTDVRNQLKLFSIQLLHRKISFTACGFFTLDMTLLQAIIGAATTYLVILIQFHNASGK